MKSCTSTHLLALCLETQSFHVWKLGFRLQGIGKLWESPGVLQIKAELHWQNCLGETPELKCWRQRMGTVMVQETEWDDVWGKADRITALGMHGLCSHGGDLCSRANGFERGCLTPSLWSCHLAWGPPKSPKFGGGKEGGKWRVYSESI